MGRATELIDIPTNRLLTLNDVAEILGMTKLGVLKTFIYTGKLREIRLGQRTIRYSPVELKNLINKMQTPSGQRHHGQTRNNP